MSVPAALQPITSTRLLSRSSRPIGSQTWSVPLRRWGLRLVLALPFVGVLALAVDAATYVVPLDFPTIQEAIDEAVSGDTVFVSPGTYFENLDFSGKDIVVEASEGPSMTTIDGSASSAGVDFGSVVRFLGGETNAAILRGFTIRGGTGTLLGGDLSGGAIATEASSPTIVGNVIENNNAVLGGAIFTKDLPSPRIDGNVIRGNTATTGGGIYTENSGPLVRNNLIIDNTASGAGGAMHVFFLSTPTITNNTIVGNSAQTGGAIKFDLFGDGNVFNSIIWGNLSNVGPVLSVSTSLPTVSFTDLQEAWSGETTGGNVELDPQFLNAGAGDYRLSSTSPLIGLGNNAAPFVPDIDLDGNDRLICVIVDLGAYEAPVPPAGCPGLFVRSDCNGDLTTDVTDAIAVLGILFLGDPTTCVDACDANSDLTLDVADALFLLGSLFTVGAPLPDSPFPECGLSPNPLVSPGCDRSSSCP